MEPPRQPGSLRETAVPGAVAVPDLMARATAVAAVMGAAVGAEDAAEG